MILRRPTEPDPAHSPRLRERSHCQGPSCNCLVCGGESVGKTQLLASLTGKSPLPENFRGSTVACETYRDGNLRWMDTPGILRRSDTAASRAALEQVDSSDRVMLVARADRAAQELPALLPSIAGKPGFVTLTFRDRLDPEYRIETEQLAASLGVPVFLVNARRLDNTEAEALRRTASAPDNKASRFPLSPPKVLPLSPAPESRRESRAEQAASHPFVALLLLFLPAALAIAYTNRFADSLYDPVASLMAQALASVASWPALPGALLGGDYGLLAMFPFLLLYALPTLLVFSAILAIYKSSGLIDRLSIALHPWLRPFGIGGRDLVRVIMGFGCNVSAIVSTRSCTTCSRGACVSAISFGAACSYQLPATLAVFAAAGMAGMGLAYLAVLTVTTLIYLRFTTPKVLRSAGNSLLITKPDPLTAPSWQSVWREVGSHLKQFVIMAFPVFIAICFAASLLDYFGILHALSRALAPLLSVFNLPAEATTAVILGSIRKDGIAIGLLDNMGGELKVALSSPAQVLSAVYLAGVLLPCLVTVFTVAREMGWKFAARLCARQMAWAAGFALIIAWSGALIF
ncbi:MAG: nucleoside recognition domain-containing protein [Verrucomicrobiota bacterium JB023]|nr:nucleoside recognition domain-containing protein [Verrucomicrobiota bacterium JB023]